MPMCPDCGASCRIVTTKAGTKIPLEEREEMTGPGRYRETEDGALLLPEDYEERAYVDHREWCAEKIGYPAV